MRLNEQLAQLDDGGSVRQTEGK